MKFRYSVGAENWFSPSNGTIWDVKFGFKKLKKKVSTQF